MCDIRSLMQNHLWSLPSQRLASAWRLRKCSTAKAGISPSTTSLLPRPSTVGTFCATVAATSVWPAKSNIAADRDVRKPYLAQFDHSPTQGCAYYAFQASCKYQATGRERSVALRRRLADGEKEDI